MSVLRKKLSQSFTVIPTATIDDVSLSYRDLGVLCHLLSLRELKWKGNILESVKSLSNFGRENLEEVSQSLDNLVATGYIHLGDPHGPDNTRSLYIRDTPKLDWLPVQDEL